MSGQRFSVELTVRLVVALAAETRAAAEAEAARIAFADAGDDYERVTVESARIVTGNDALEAEAEQVRTPRARRAEKARSGGQITRIRTASVEERAAAVWTPGMGIAALEKAAGISRASAQKYAAQFRARQQAVQ